MRTFVMLLFVVLSGTLGFAQKTEIPLTVKKAFAALYPNVANAKWEKEGANYEAEFKLKGTEISVVIDKNGKILETERQIATAELPAKATTYIAANYSGKKIAEASKITSGDGVVRYEAEVGNSDLMFDAKGNFSESVKKDKGDPDDKQ